MKNEQQKTTTVQKNKLMLMKMNTLKTKDCCILNILY